MDSSKTVAKTKILAVIIFFDIAYELIEVCTPQKKIDTYK
jgi:hypothetical protein